MSTNAENLGRCVKARRMELELTQLEVWMAGGPSNSTLTKIEKGGLEGLEWATARKLDKGLRWREGSAKAVWLGGEPTPLEPIAPPLEVVADFAAKVEASNLDPATKAHILRIHAEDLAREKEQQGRGTA